MNGVRQSLTSVHTWAGLTLGWILYFMFVTGSASYFRNEIDHWMKPEIPVFSIDRDQTELLGLVEEHVAARAPDTLHWYVSFPHRRYPMLAVGWWDGLETQVDVLDPETAQRVVPRETAGGRALYEMHFELHYLPHVVADWLVSTSTMFMFVAIITGVIVHKKILRELFTFRPGKGQRSWLDLHNVFGVLTLPFQIMITYTGLLFLAHTSMPAIAGLEPRGARAAEPHAATAPSAAPAPLSDIFAFVERRWGENQIAWIEVDEPGEENPRVVVARQQNDTLAEDERLVFDRMTGTLAAGSGNGRSAPEQLTESMLGLHLALFADTPLRWLFFLSGAFGAGMVATGLLLWTAKRRKQAEARSGEAHRGLALVERLNVGTIAGLPIGLACYFVANRALPLELDERAAAEIDVLFAAWAIAFVYAALRPLRRAWEELLAAAAALFALVPLLNAVATDRHLGASLAAGDWIFAGFDLAMLALGSASAAAAAVLVRGRRRRESSPSLAASDAAAR